MNEIKWYDVAEQKPAEGQIVLTLSKVLNTKTPQVSEAICTFKNGQFWMSTSCNVTRGEHYEPVARMACDMIYENVFAWTDLAAIYERCELLKDMIKEE